MILSAMIFAGVTMVFGIVLGFLLGQARSRMNYEEELHKAAEARATLESQIAHLRDMLGPESQVQAHSPGTGAADGPKV